MLYNFTHLFVLLLMLTLTVTKWLYMLPLSVEAQEEARKLMASNKNLLKPQSGEPIVNPSNDIILAVFG
jgi:hypothetical protein